jgi:hypothetical protein
MGQSVYSAPMKAPQPTKRIIERLHRHAKTLQGSPDTLVPGLPQRVLLTLTAARAMANTNWQAAGRLEGALTFVRLLASYDCADANPALCGECGTCLARQFLTDAGDDNKENA